MDKKNRFDISKLKGRLSSIRDWMKDHHFPPRLLFFLMGIISTLWFLIRVIPKPSRAEYPCMQVAAPFMSGFVVYLLSIGGITLALRKARQNILRARFIAAGLFVLVALAGLVISLTQNSQNSSATSLAISGPDDGPNQPIGKALGVNPGRVVWIWNPEATNEKCVSNFDTKDWYFKPENTNRKVVGNMVINSLNKLCGKNTLAESWDVLFRYQNLKKYQKNRGYTKGEKIFIKINQGTSKWMLSQEDRNNGYYFPTELKPTDVRRRTSLAPTETGPYIVLELLRELVNELGINQADISVGDPITNIYAHNYNIWVAEFPGVAYVDRTSTKYGRTLITPTSNDLLFYSDKTQSDKLFDVIVNADYLINVANLKPHAHAGISLTAKNHFGSHASPTASHLHYSLMVPRGGIPTNGGYHKYRVLVDMMGSKYLGQNTMLYLVDGLFGGGAKETMGPVKYFMSPFKNDWSNSIFVSQDQVALESVCFDILRTEWNGINKHDKSNNDPENGPNMNGVDDYLHQAADAANWPPGIIYDPDNLGKPLASLGVHEHWNSAEKKQYSRNLGIPNGVELISIPETLIGGEGERVSSRQSGQQETDGGNDKKVNPKASFPDKKETKEIKESTVLKRSFDGAFQAKNFYSVTIDDENTKWFLTEAGIVSFNGKVWNIHDKNRKIPNQDLKDMVYDFSDFGKELWIATPQGATVASLPIDARSGATTYYLQNSKILSENVVSVAIGKGSLRWFGTDKGISAFYNDKWLSYSYQRKYPEYLFKDFPITDMATSPDGDSLYVATNGAGVARVFRNDVDAISGASEYAQWGPIEIPSDKVYSIWITPEGIQWFGTDKGVARHTGYKTLENWTVFNTGNGLIDNFVQCIAADRNGNVWFGTKNGVSVFDGSIWTSFTEKDGLTSNNIHCIKVDKEGIVWLGTDKGVSSYIDGKFTGYN